MTKGAQGNPVALDDKMVSESAIAFYNVRDTCVHTLADGFEDICAHRSPSPPGESANGEHYAQVF
jgi:hypothetical protein